MKSFAAAVVFCCALNLFSAGVNAVAMDKVSVSAEFVNAPSISYSGSFQFSPMKTSLTNRWVMVVVEFTPVYVDGSEKKSQDGSKARVKNKQFERIARRWLDDLNVRVRVLCETVGANDQPQYALFAGSAKLWSVRVDKNKHYALFFVPAHLIDRYYYPHRLLKDNGANRKNTNVLPDTVFKLTNPNVLKLEAVLSVNNNNIAKAYAGLKKKKGVEAENEFNSYVSRVPGNCNIEGAVLSKGQSPWAFYKIDQFELEKTVAR